MIEHVTTPEPTACELAGVGVSMACVTPRYIVGGIAIHGNPAVPSYPDSHGCIRIPMFAAKAVSSMMPVGTLVIVHDGGSLANIPAHIRKQSDKALVTAR